MLDNLDQRPSHDKLELRIWRAALLDYHDDETRIIISAAAIRDILLDLSILDDVHIVEGSYQTFRETVCIRGIDSLASII